MRDEEILKTSKEDIIKFVMDSYSFVEVSDKMNIDKNTAKYDRLKRYVRNSGINYDHFERTGKKTKEKIRSF